ncbi:hypothetical protein F5B19DRAFT_327371 [Rostrohypoxylon terebratum]|nr:hypothetical protein F5B19DRAFT_327371 [Rostrohypoxylon terebratum]
MSSLLRRKFPSILHSSVLPIPPAYRKPLLLGTAAAVISAPLLSYTYRCYTEWLSLGRGGVPYHFFGWLAQSTLHLIARTDLREPVPKKYKTAEDVGALYGSAGTRSYLYLDSDESPNRRSIPSRTPPRPTVPSFVAPQRQTTDGASARTVEALNRYLVALAAANPDLFEVKASQLEGPLYQAIWLRQPAPDQSLSVSASEVRDRVGRGTTGEFAHVHGEGSTHVTLSPVDASQLIAKGWAERHGMSGVGGTRWGMAPWGYVLIYAPRDEGELEVWREVLLAGARYVSQGLGKTVVAPGEEGGDEE